MSDIRHCILPMNRLKDVHNEGRAFWLIHKVYLEHIGSPIKGCVASRPWAAVLYPLVRAPLVMEKAYHASGLEMDVTALNVAGLISIVPMRHWGVGQPEIGLSDLPIVVQPHVVVGVVDDPLPWPLDRLCHSSLWVRVGCGHGRGDRSGNGSGNGSGRVL